VSASHGGGGGDARAAPSIIVVVTWEGTGEPVVDLPVHALRAEGGAWAPRADGRTDARGEARLPDLVAGTWVVRTALGAKQAEVEVGEGESVRVRFAIARGVQVLGEVVGANGLPIGGASIWLSEPWDDAQGAEVAVSGADGRFVIEGAHRGQSVGASAPGYAASAVVPVQSDAGSREVRLVLAVPMGTVRGLVRDQSGAPVGGARILLGSPDRPFDRRGADGARLRGPAPALVEADDDGRFVAEHLEPGAARVEADAEGHGPFLGEVTIASGGVTDVVLTLPAAGAVRGVCRDGAGTPIAGVVVGTEGGLVLGTRQARSRDDGSYVLEGLAEGLTVLAAARRQGAVDVRGEVVVVAGRETTWDPVFEDSGVGHAGSVRGRVLDLRGQPLPGYRLVAEPQPRGAGANATATVGPDGAFELPAATERVRVLVFGTRGFAGFPVVVLDDVAQGRDDLDVRIDALGLSGLRGRVLDPTGQPTQAKVQVWHDDARVFREVVVDPATGSFAFDPAPPGTCTVEVRSESHPWQRFAGQRLEPGRVTDLGDVVLAAGGRIEGSVAFEDGGAPTSLTLRFVDEAAGREVGVATVDGGRFRSNPLPLGALTLVVEGEGVGATRLPLPLDAATPFRVVDLRVTRGLPVTLRVELPSGFVRPDRLAIGLIRDAEVIWTRGLGATSALEVQLSLAPGSYRALLRGDGPLADVAFDVGAAGRTVLLRPGTR
ncbi:MAG: carboxypeptidase-like regulatory domain-containing protein, partial [Planctomycetota bacterium]|nr:carboxypeptidase-like regulatory domain-containing protein [Planctomycetota bacterium]